MRLSLAVGLVLAVSLQLSTPMSASNSVARAAHDLSGGIGRGLSHLAGHGIRTVKHALGGRKQDNQSATREDSAATTGGGFLSSHGRPVLKGHVSIGEQTTVVGRRIDELLDAALERDPQSAALDKAVEHYRSKCARASAMVRDDADLLFSYRGFGPSSEAGDIITGEKLKVKSRASAEYVRQKHIDNLHTRIVSGILQIAMGLGMSDKAQARKTVDSGRDDLMSLVGSHKAAETTRLLSSWSNRIRVPDGVFRQRVWDVSRRNQMSDTVIKTALARDPVVVEILNHLHKYNHLPKLMRASGSVFLPLFGVMSRTPALHNAGTPALVAFVTATGGPEQAKIMKELYLDRRFVSRVQVINEETHMALDNYQLAVVTHNPTLLACSESVIQNLAGSEVIRPLFGRSVLPQDSRTLRSAAGVGLTVYPPAASNTVWRVRAPRHNEVLMSSKGTRGLRASARSHGGRPNAVAFDAGYE